MAYMILYTLSPILNTFVETVSARLFISVLAVFFFLEFTYGIFNLAAFNSGYSAMSFIGLYLLARFISKYSLKIRILNLSILSDFLLYLLFSVVPIILYFLTGQGFNMLAYSSPFVILASMFFFLAFTKIHISSKTINYLACSTLSIYLIHLHPLIYNHFINLMRWAYDLFGEIPYILFTIVFAICFGLCCIILDKGRIWLWDIICKHILNSTLSQFNKFIDKLYTRIGL